MDGQVVSMISTEWKIDELRCLSPCSQPEVDGVQLGLGLSLWTAATMSE
jgi:hypothetical protein